MVQGANQQERLGDLDLGWLVGVLESEGCLRIQRSNRRRKKIYYGVMVTITNTNPTMIEEAHRILKQAEIGHHVKWLQLDTLQKYRVKARKPVAHVSIWGCGRVGRLLDVVGNQWRSRQEEAALLQAFVDGPLPKYGPFYDDLYLRCRAIKQYPQRPYAGVEGVAYKTAASLSQDMVQTTAKSVE